MEQIKTAFIGFGYRGRQLFELIRRIPSFRVVAVADPAADAQQAGGWACYNRDADDYRRMLCEQSVDLVVVASPWLLQTQHALHSVEAGCHVAIEIKGGLAMGEYDALIDLSSRRKKRVFPLENALFMEEILAVLQMAEDGVLGEIVHMRGGYRHDLRDILIDEHGRLGNPNRPEGTWRHRFYRTENADLYPTHGLAPLCLIAGVGRRDPVRRLTSFASKARGIARRVSELGGDAEGLHVATGDIVCTQLETESGVIISLTHDTTLPRPRSLDFEVQGTKGIWQGDTRRIYIEGRSPLETWESDAPYIARYAHPYWTRWGEEAMRIDTHHRGMDYIMLRAVAADLQGETTYPVTVADLALWCSVTPLSKTSIAERRTLLL